MTAEITPQVGEQRGCATCGTKFVLSEAAPHKRFCSDVCRREWHKNQRREALKQMKLREGLGFAQEGQ